MRLPSFLVLIAFVSCREYRAYDNYGNNINNLTWGQAGGTYGFIQGPCSYANTATGAPKTNLPNPRNVSNVLFSANSIYNSVMNADTVVYWGQFLVHTTILSTPSTVSMNIPVPACDPIFDPSCTGTVVIPFLRNAYTNSSGTYQVINSLSPYVDAQSMYGVNTQRALALRAMVGGQMLTQTGANNDVLPPNNVNLFQEAGSLGTQLFFTGDVRGNENPIIASFTTLFLREHNRKAAELQTTLNTNDDELLYQEARVWVTALIQQITYNEYLPQRLGQALPLYTAYDPTINTQIDTFFMTCAMRYGHSAINTVIYRVDEDRNPIPQGHLLLRDSFFNPMPVKLNGIEPILRGLTLQAEAFVDTIMVADLRNYFSGSPAIPFDLAAYDIQRTRDQGTPFYNDARVGLGLPPITSWAAFPGNPTVVAALQSLYGTINNLDGWVGGLAELQNGSSTLGPLFTASLIEQFTRMRNGDRFWYESPGVLRVPSDLTEIHNTKLSTVILRNTNIAGMPQNMFRTGQSLSPSSASSSGCTASTLTGFTCMTAISSTETLHWDVSSSNLITLGLQVTGTFGWMGLGVSSSGLMVGSDAVIATGANGNSPVFGTYTLSSRAISGITANSAETITNAKITVTGGTTVLSFSRTASNGGTQALNLQGTNTLVYAYGSSATFTYHGSSRGVVQWGVNGATVVAMHDLWKVSHAVLMSASWGVLLPVGMFSARFLRHKPPTSGPRAFWFITHMTCQLVGYATALAGFILALVQFNFSMFSLPHSIMGFVVMVLGLLQVTNGLLRPNHESRFRLVWERIHHATGRAALLLAIPTIFLGLQRAEMYFGADINSWGTIVYGILLLGLALVFIIYSRTKSGFNFVEMNEPSSNIEAGGEGSGISTAKVVPMHATF